MVDALLRGKRIHSAAVEAAFREVPRHLFLPGVSTVQSYVDEAVTVQVCEGVATSSASQPSMMAIMLEQLDLRPGHRVLEIGAGTGYNAALLARLVGPAGAVTSIDIDDELVASAAVHLAAAGVEGIELICADGATGHPGGAPYDRIVLTVGSDDVRPEWIAQLAPDGRILLPLAVRGSQLAVALDLGADGVLRSHSVRSCMFIRLRGIAAGGARPAVHPHLGLAVETPSDSTMVDVDAVLAALDVPGRERSLPVELGRADVWDGLGLWLALTEPGTCRLLAPADEDAVLADELIPLGPGAAAPALAGSSGIAVVVGRGSAVRAYGVGGDELAQRLGAAADAWLTAGRPGAADWRISVVPGSREGNGGPGVVRKQSCTVLAALTGAG